jgi:hypothetical protein
MLTVENIRIFQRDIAAINIADSYAYEKILLAFYGLKMLPCCSYEIPQGQQIYRTRIDDKTCRWTKCADISLPPPSVVKSFARCNRPLQSVFYGSKTHPVSYMELATDWARSKKNGDKIVLITGYWVTKSPLFALMITTPDAANRVSEYDKEHGQALDRYIAQMDEETREYTILFYRFLFEHFSKVVQHNDLTYLITSAYCNLVMAKNENVNCIYYPSVQDASGKGINFAISAKFINNDNIELKQVGFSELTVSKIDNKESFIETSGFIADKIVIGTGEIQL